VHLLGDVWARKIDDDLFGMWSLGHAIALMVARGEGELLRNPGFAQGEIDEARPGDLGFLNGRIEEDRLRDGGGDTARILLEPLCQRQRGVELVVAMTIVRRRFQE